MRRLSSALALVLLLSTLPSQAKEHDEKNTVELTWMSIANWYFKVGPLKMVMDGYITRVPNSIFVRSTELPADQFAFTGAPRASNVTDVMKVRYGLGVDSLDYVLAGHSHFDHTYDPRSGQRSRARRSSAACPPATNPFQHFGRELSGPPTPDAATGGVRAGVAEDYPNGGGGRAFLFTVGKGRERASFFVNNSASAFDLNAPVTVNGVSFGSPLENLAAAMRDAGLTSVDVWIGAGAIAVDSSSSR